MTVGRDAREQIGIVAEPACAQIANDPDMDRASAQPDAASNPVTVTLLPSNGTTPPTPPNVFWASDSPGCGFVDFMWDGAGDNADGWFQLEFEIYEDGLFRGVWRDEAFEASFGTPTKSARSIGRATVRSPAMKW